MDQRQFIVVLVFFSLTVAAVPQTSTPPVRILKQVNRQNEDGSYSYGYENEDGSYKIETKTALGDVSGKYGYYDVTGKLREIEYGASSKRGFEPVGPGITVPPPTLHVQNQNVNNIEADYDDGQYREDPSIYDKTDAPLTKFSAGPKIAPPVHHQGPNFRFESQPQASQYRYYRPTHNANPAYNVDPAYYQGQQAGNYDPYTGSYTINYQG